MENTNTPQIRWNKWRKEQVERCIREERDMAYMVKLLDLPETEITDYISRNFGKVVDFVFAKEHRQTEPDLRIVENVAKAAQNSTPIMDAHMVGHMLEMVSKVAAYKKKLDECTKKLEASQLRPEEQLHWDFMFNYYRTLYEHWDAQYENLLVPYVQQAVNSELYKK